MLASLRIVALLLGLGIGALTATVLSLVFWLVLSAGGFEDAALAGLTVALLVALTVGGYAAGRMAVVAHRFHGSVTGLALAALVLVIARLGGSPAPTAQVLWLALLGVVLGGLGGTLAGMRRIG
ncbi:MAG: TIGR04086 family membrane protein [Acidimicrobiia bacterium]